MSKSLLTPDYERQYIQKPETVRSAKRHRKVYYIYDTGINCFRLNVKKQKDRIGTICQQQN